MQSPSAFEVEDEVLQVLELCEPVEEIREVVVTTGEVNLRTPTVASSGPSSKSNQVWLSSALVFNWLDLDHYPLHNPFYLC